MIAGIIKAIILIIVVAIVLIVWGICALVGGLFGSLVENPQTVEEIKIEIQETDLKIQETMIDTKRKADSIWDREYDKYLESLEKEIQQRREDLRK